MKHASIDSLSYEVDSTESDSWMTTGLCLMGPVNFSQAFVR